MSDPHATLDACLTDLADNKPAEDILLRLRGIESALSADALTRARFLRARAIATNRLGFAGEALGDLHEARRLLEGGAHSSELAEVFRAIATVFSWRGESREAALALLRAVAEASATDDKAALSLALIEGGRLQMEIGRPAEAQALLHRALETGAALLPRREYQRAWINLLQAGVSAGQIDAARAQLAGSVDVLAGAPTRLLLLSTLAAVRVALKSGDIAGAAAALENARGHAPEATDAFERIEIAEVEAEIALARGDAQSAATLLAKVIARHAEDDLASREVPARLTQAKALEALGRIEEAERTLAAALRRALARGLSGYADEVRSRLATNYSGHTRIADLPATADTDIDRRFVRQRTLGQGAHGKVLRAYDLELGFEVAIKRAARGAQYDPATRDRLLDIALTEVAAASRLDHPGIARVFGLLTAGGDTLVIEEFVEGPTLRAAMDDGLDPSRKLDLLSRIAYALAAVHSAGVIHRDLKPDNIVLRGGDAPVLIDFGVALLAGQQSKLDAGTPAYMAPEQAHGGKVDARADLYALGVIAHEMLTGRRPALPKGTSRFASYGHIRRTRFALTDAGVSPDIANVVSRLLAPHPALRPSDIVGNLFVAAARS